MEQEGNATLQRVQIRNIYNHAAWYDWFTKEWNPRHRYDEPFGFLKFVQLIPLTSLSYIYPKDSPSLVVTSDKFVRMLTKTIGVSQFSKNVQDVWKKIVQLLDRGFPSDIRPEQIIQLVIIDGRIFSKEYVYWTLIYMGLKADNAFELAEILGNTHYNPETLRNMGDYSLSDSVISLLDSFTDNQERIVTIDTPTILTRQVKRIILDIAYLYSVAYGKHIFARISPGIIDWMKKELFVKPLL